MKVTSLADMPRTGPDDARRRIAIGTFDGVHVGHREVIRGNDTVLTFDPHPVSVIHPEAAPKLLAPFSIKRDLIGGLGVEELVVNPFDRDFASQTAEEFVDEVLVGQLSAESVSVGENFRFGRGAKGTPEFLAADDRFETRVVPLVEAAGETASSSHIRGLVAAGDVRTASEFLGGPFLVEGEVVSGDLYGQTLRIAFIDRMRGEKRFDSVDALVEQMQADVREAERICAATSY